MHTNTVVQALRCLYSAYAWLCSLLITILSYLVPFV